MAILVLSLGGCGGASGGDDDAGNDESISYVESSMETLPVFNETQQASAMSRRTVLPALPDIQWGNAADEILYLFLDPEPYEADGSSLGVNNIYHLLNDMDGAMSAVSLDACTGMSGVDRIPFFEDHDSSTFFAEPFTHAYTCSGNGDQAYGLMSGSAQEGMYVTGASNGSSVYQGAFDQATNNLRMRLVGIWPAGEAPGSYFTMRSEFEGDPEAHQFTLRLTKYGTTEGAYYIQMVGTGVSQGADGHFLMAVRDNSFQTGGEGTTLGELRYFCYSAADKAATDDTETIETTSPCQPYKSEVDAQTGLLHSDLPLELFDVEVTAS
jgi:hypothetical protein